MTASIEPVGVGAVRVEKFQLRAGIRPIFFDETVSQGATQLEVEVSSDDGTPGNVSVLILHLPEEGSSIAAGSSMVAYNATPGTHKKILVRDPVPGRYRVAIDPVSIGDPERSFTYRQTLFHPAYGMLKTQANHRRLDKGGTGTVQVEVEMTGKPPEGRSWVAQVALFAEDVREMIREPAAEQKEAVFGYSRVPVSSYTWRIGEFAALRTHSPIPSPYAR